MAFGKGSRFSSGMEEVQIILITVIYSFKLFEPFSLVNYYNSSRFAICWVNQDRVLKLVLFYVVFQDYPHV